MLPHRLALLATLVASLTTAAPRPALAVAPDREAVQASERELEVGLADYAKADYAGAIEHFERAYALHPSPQYLYAWAQAERSRGNCEAAIELYRRFVDTGATGASREAALQNETRCRDELAARAETTDEVAPEPEILAIEPAPLTEPAPERPRRDGLGIALVATGGVALGAGAVLLGIAGARQGRLDDQTDYDRFHTLDRQILRLDVAGGLTLGVGAALAIAGVIRLAVSSRRARADRVRAGLDRAPLLLRSGVLVTPAVDPRGTAMLLLRLPLGRGGRSFDRHE